MSLHRAAKPFSFNSLKTSRTFICISVLRAKMRKMKRKRKKLSKKNYYLPKPFLLQQNTNAQRSQKPEACKIVDQV